MRNLTKTLAVAFVVAGLTLPGLAVAKPGGVPADPALEKSRGSANAHPKKDDPNPDQGADSAGGTCTFCRP